MRVLLDTHTLLLAAYSPKFLGKRASAIIADGINVALVSAASAWEIAAKIRAGKLPGAEVLESEFMELTMKAGYTLLPISVESALRAGRLSGDHSDPFDRILAAQALEEDIPILSSDTKLDSFGIRRIW